MSVLDVVVQPFGMAGAFRFSGHIGRLLGAGWHGHVPGTTLVSAGHVLMPLSGSPFLDGGTTTSVSRRVPFSLEYTTCR